MTENQQTLFDLPEESGNDSDLQSFSADVPTWELAAAEDVLVASVVFNRPLETAYSYRIPDELRPKLRPGQRVRVPFGQGNTSTIGYVVEIAPPKEPSRRLKAIRSIVDSEPLLSPRMLILTKWIAERYLCAWGQVLESVIPAGVKNLAGTRLTNMYQAGDNVENLLQDPVTKIAPKQRAVLETLVESNRPLRLDELTRAARCTTSPIQALRKRGLVRVTRERLATHDPVPADIPSETDLELNPDQTQAVEAVVRQLRSGTHRTFLLHGVTGSGKTEVYIQAIREVVGYGRQAIVLVPEISLTPQTIRRFRARFPSVAVLHSHLSDSDRHHHWGRIARGEVQVVVGARSAIFAPVPHLGLIVIDEEHETSFKQESVPRYHTREVARKRAELDRVPLILGSATPTLESWVRVQPDWNDDGHAESPQDQLLTLPRRAVSRPMPPVVIVDTRNDPRIRKGQAIGRSLETAIRAAFDDGGQVILFLNLRGFSPTLWCRGCGESVRCRSCDITLTWHRDRNVALCHFCDFECEPPQQCPACGAGGLIYFGIGTQKLEQEVRERFPGRRILRMDSDSMRRPGSHDAALTLFREGNVDLLLGTQMIAKGLDFPNVTLVGVIDADTILHQPDLRSSERTFQLIVQVAGRTGRGEKGGRVLVQTASPEEPAIRLATRHDYLGFARQELRHRSELATPPYTHLTRIILRGPHEPRVEETADYLADLMRDVAGRERLPVRILGPAPAPIARLRDNYRWHFQLAAEQIVDIATLWRAIQSDLPTTRDVEFVIDVDPMNMR